jgi:hypothetical protein
MGGNFSSRVLQRGPPVSAKPSGADRLPPDALQMGFRPFRRPFSGLTQRVRSIHGVQPAAHDFSAGFAAFLGLYISDTKVFVK